jgi:hypothetical protein
MTVLGTQLGIWAGAGWGLAGGMCVEALWLHSHIRSAARWSWRKPIPQGLTAYVISVVTRVGAGAVVAAAAAGSNQASGTLAAFGIGVAAPLVVQKLARGVPLTGYLTDHPEPSAIEPTAENLAKAVPLDEHLTDQPEPPPTEPEEVENAR